jgi:DNA-binding transcriptional LysR family regulator
MLGRAEATQHGTDPPMADGPSLQHVISRLRLRHFDFLDRLGRDMNMGRVAMSMNMSQPTATKMLQEIEETLGLALFDRNRRGVTPTIAGEALIRRAGLILSDIAAGHRELDSIRVGGVALIRLGVFPVVTAELLPQLYMALHASHPGMRLSVEEGDEVGLTRRLLQGRIDVILGRIDPDRLTAELAHRIFYTEATVIVCGPQNRIIDLDPAAILARMAESEWILPTSQGGAFRLIAGLLVRAGHSVPRVAVESISVLATSGLLSRTDMLGIMPASVSRGYSRLGLLRELPVTLPMEEFPVGVVFRRDIGESALIRQIVDSCNQAARELVRDSTRPTDAPP